MTKRDGGFTLIEALAGLAATAAVLAAVAAVAGQWLPSWRHGFQALQNADIIALSVDRIVADVSSAEYARLDGPQSAPLFRGEPNAVVFVREAVGPDAAPRLEAVRIGETATGAGLEAQRAHAAFTPGSLGQFRDAATLLRPPFRIEFAYAGADRRWRASWSGLDALPRAFRLTVRGADGAALASTAFLMKVSAAPEIAAPAAGDGGEAK